MATYDKEFFEILDAMKNHGACQRFFAKLREVLDTTRVRNDTLDGTELYRSQGKAQFISEILLNVEETEENLRRINSNSRKHKGGGPA